MPPAFPSSWNRSTIRVCGRLSRLDRLDRSKMGEQGSRGRIGGPARVGIDLPSGRRAAIRPASVGHGAFLVQFGRASKADDGR